ncbi:MAG: divalent metal cation transporter [Bacteroidales bacterium]|nr:divalent metal cation transporter [Bacteroidales bacterium]
MKLFKNIKGRVLNILFWSIISAAFIGPGTVTTATKAGADCGFQLLWALGFATIACIVLQEASARATIYSGLNLGQAIKKHFQGTKMELPAIVLVVGAIILGCAAYETGNILGSVEGVALMFPGVEKWMIVAVLGILAAAVLAMKDIKIISNIMGAFVFLMGFTFIAVAILGKPSVGDIASGFVPTVPNVDGVSLLVLGLIGTTIVPYDIFLGSSVVQKETTIRDMRIGVTVSVVIGGFISMAILVVGTQMSADAQVEGFSYELLTRTLQSKIGMGAVYVFGVGLFAAGFTSAITSPLISALTAQSLFAKEAPKDPQNKQKSHRSFIYISYIVLSIGLIFGFMQVEPVPAIIMAQAFNGLILPFVSIFLFTIINDEKIMGREHVNSLASNIVMILVTWMTLVLGLVKIIKAFWSIDFIQHLCRSILGRSIPSTDEFFVLSASLAVLITAAVVFFISRRRSNIGKIKLA